MNTLKAGFARADITPMLGIYIGGYFVPRYAEEILDPLELVALAVEAGSTTAVLVTIDQCSIGSDTFEALRNRVAEATGLPLANIFVHLTHTHTSAGLGIGSDNELVQEYTRMVMRKIGDVAQMALKDLQPAKMGWAVGNAPKIAFVRRFRMKDGKVRTNPGVGNPDILAPIGDVDERLNVLRFDRECGDTLILGNFGNHPDTVGGSRISADWPGMTRRMVEHALENTKCIFFNGAQGDVNHVNVNAKGGDYNDLTNDFDDVARGYGHTRHMARVMTGAILQVFDKVNWTDVDSVRTLQKVVHAPSHMPTEKDNMELAHKYRDLHNADKDEEIPFEGMELTTVVAEALRLCNLEQGPESYPLVMTGIAIGSVALFGIPGEPFTGIGRGLKEAQGWDLVLPCCQTNDRIGYFPMQEAYDEGGYEARSSYFKAGVAELIIKEGTDILNQLRA